MFLNGTHYRFGKKVCFESNPSQVQVLNDQLGQKNYKSLVASSEKQNQRTYDANFLQSIKEQLLTDKRKKYELLLKMRKEFQHENRM